MGFTVQFSFIGGRRTTSKGLRDYFAGLLSVGRGNQQTKGQHRLRSITGDDRFDPVPPQQALQACGNQ